MRQTHDGKTNPAIVSDTIPPIFCICEEGEGQSGPSGRTEDEKMQSLIAQIREEAAKRALYRRTRDEIAAMPRHIALDLGIFPEDAARLARQAVWG